MNQREQWLLVAGVIVYVCTSIFVLLSMMLLDGPHVADVAFGLGALGALVLLGIFCWWWN